MKYIGVLLVCASLAGATDFMTGQAARLVIGQVNFTAVDATAPSNNQVGAASGLAYANNTLFVADANRIQVNPIWNRVLIFNNLRNSIPPPTAPIAQGSNCPLCVGGFSVVLGQPDFTTSNTPPTPPTTTSLRTPTAVASDGKILVVADTDDNRVLIWKTIPQTNDTPPDIVLGQPNLTTIKPITVDASSLRGPQGVWIQGSRLFVADTQNSRILVWNNIPTTNGQAADYVLGEPNLTTAPSASTIPTAKANNLYFPVSVTSDGQRLYVTDLGFNRVLIWNTIPTTNGQPADVVIGQPDMVSSAANNVTALCASNGTDSNGKPTYPGECGATLNFPRYALSDGTRLFIADSGNDRVLIFNSIPNQNGQNGDVALGQYDLFSDSISSTNSTFDSATNAIRNPMSLAYDGTNLYVTDPFNLRILVFTPGQATVPVNGIVNAANPANFATGQIILGGTINAGDVLTVTINGTAYTYTVVKTDTLATVTQNITNVINDSNSKAGDPNVHAFADTVNNIIQLTAKQPGPAGNAVTYVTSVSTGAQLTSIPSATTNLSGGATAQQLSPGTLVTINGTNLADSMASGQPNANGYYPTSLAGVQVYINGVLAPLLYVSPTQINTQIPFAAYSNASVSAYVRTTHADGSVTVTAATAVPITPANPGLFAQPGGEPRVAIAVHASSYAVGLIDVGGTIQANDTITITVNNVGYTYTIQSSDTIQSVQQALINMINADANSPVTASIANSAGRILLTAKIAGPDGNGIPIAASTGGKSPMITVNAVQGQTTGAYTASNSAITPDNPAVPGELIGLFAAGLGTVLPEQAQNATDTGLIYNGPANYTNTAVDSALVGNLAADIVQAFLAPGMVGVYEVVLLLDAGLPTNPTTTGYISQGIFTSNTVTIPVVAPPSS